MANQSSRASHQINSESQELTVNIKQQLANKALSFLAKREYSHHELYQKLLNYSEDTHLITQILNEFKEQNLQSDERFVEFYVRSHAHRGKGPNWIRYQLSQHQLSEHLIEQELDNPELNWHEITCSVLSKKLGSTNINELEFAQKAKLFNFMQNRGFSIDWVNKAFNTVG